MTLFFNPFITFGTGYSGMISEDAPIGYWRMGDPPGSTTIADSSATTAYTGNVNGTLTFSESGVADGTSIGFGGAAANYIRIPSTPSYTSFSVEFWFYWNAATTNQGLVTRSVADATNSDWLFFTDATLLHWRVINDAGATTSVISTTRPPPGMWHHVVGVCHANQMMLYVDGKQVGSTLAVTRTTAKGAGDILFGKLGGSTTYSLNGRIDEVAYYNYALTPARIQEHFQSVMLDTYDRLVMSDLPRLYYRLDDTSSTGTVARDLSGNAIHGAYSGTPALASRLVGGWTAADFDGVNDYVAVPSINTTGWAGVTMECWCTLDASINLRSVFSQIYTGGSDPITLEMGQAQVSNVFTLSRYSGSAWATASSGQPLALGTLYHLVGTITAAGLMVLYVNGVEVASQSTTFVPDTEGWYIGRRWDVSGGSPYVDGAIARAALYDRALGAAEVLEHYQVGVGL